MSHCNLILSIEKDSRIKYTSKEATKLIPNCRIPWTTQQKVRQIFHLTTLTKLTQSQGTNA